MSKKKNTCRKSKEKHNVDEKKAQDVTNNYLQ